MLKRDQILVDQGAQDEDTDLLILVSLNTNEETICLQCGDKGFTNAFVYCVKCLQFAVHRYCLSVVPKSLDEFVRWVCSDCEMDLVERCPKRLKKQLSIDNITLADRINKATRRKHKLQTSDSPAPAPVPVLLPPRHHNHPPQLITYKESPETIHVKPNEFKSLVQRLTGPDSSSPPYLCFSRKRRPNIHGGA